MPGMLNDCFEEPITVDLAHLFKAHTERLFHRLALNADLRNQKWSILPDLYT